MEPSGDIVNQCFDDRMVYKMPGIYLGQETPGSHRRLPRSIPYQVLPPPPRLRLRSTTANHCQQSQTTTTPPL